MEFKAKVESDIEMLEKILEMLKDADCDVKSIAIVSSWLETAKQVKELENA